MYTIDTASDGWHGGLWEIRMGDTVIAGPEEVTGSGGSIDFVVRAPEPCRAIRANDLPHVAPGQCLGTGPDQTCPYVCAEGYEPVFGSASTVTCIAGAWAVGTAACGLPCSSPTGDDVLNIVPDMCDGTLSGGPCEFACAAGFYKHEFAIPNIYCGADGSWNVGLAECLDSAEDPTLIEVTYPASCAHLKAAFDFLPSDTYFVRPNNEVAPMSVYCDMTTQDGGWTMLVTREYGYETSLAGSVNPSTPRTGLTDTLYQAIKAINSEEGELMMRVRSKNPDDWSDVGPCAGSVCVTDEAVAGAIERTLYAGTTPVRMADDCGGGTACGDILDPAGGSTIGIVHDTSIHAAQLTAEGAAQFALDPRWSCAPDEISALDGSCSSIRINGSSGLYNTTCVGSTTLCDSAGAIINGLYYQDIRDTAVTMFSTTNIGDRDWSFRVSATDASSSTIETVTGSAPQLSGPPVLTTGLWLSNCGPTRTSKSIYHLFLVDGQLSPNATLESTVSDGCADFVLPSAADSTDSDGIAMGDAAVRYMSLFGVGRGTGAAWANGKWAEKQTDRLSCWNGAAPTVQLIGAGGQVFVGMSVQTTGRVIQVVFAATWRQGLAYAALRVLLPTSTPALTASCFLNIELAQSGPAESGNYLYVTGPSMATSYPGESAFAAFVRGPGMPFDREFSFDLNIDLTAATTAAAPVATPVSTVAAGDVISRAQTDTDTASNYFDPGIRFQDTGRLTAWNLWATGAGSVQMQVWRTSGAASGVSSDCVPAVTAIASSIVAPYTINWDRNTQGQIQDGGNGKTPAMPSDSCHSVVFSRFLLD